ncbi:MAG TPA: hypothetical protein VGK20_15960 [Candidatus Binatia bacterium]|jgi:hypothetical protein
MIDQVVQWMQHELNMTTSAIIVVGFSFLVIAMDEYIIKGWRQRHWEKLAASGDQEKIELLRMAKNAHVVDE